MLPPSSSYTANTQWRKVQDRLEDDERCSRLDITDRLEIFQEYIRDLEKEEEEEKIQKDQLRRKERKNWDEFRRLMEDHKATGLLTAKTHWLDCFAKVKDHPAYLAMASNTSGSPPKDLFEDAVEEMKKQDQEEIANIKDALKAGKYTVTSEWTLDKFKSSIGEVYDLAAASNTNLKLVFEELLEQAKEKEEKEGKKRQRLANDFMDLLYSVKEIVASSKWEDCIPLLKDAQVYRAISDESFCREIFDEYIAHLQEKVKEKKRKRDEEKSDDRGKTPSLEGSIHREVQPLLCDNDIAYSANLLEMIRKTQKKCNEEILQLLFIVPQTDEIREKDFLRPHDAAGHDQGTGGATRRVGFGTSVDPNVLARTSHHPTPSFVPILSTFLSTTLSMQALHSAPSGSEHIPEHASSHVPGDAKATISGDIIVAFPGSSRITSTGTLPVTFVVTEDFVPIKNEKVLGNDIFYKHLNDITLEIFGPTIRTGWNAQNQDLKDELINRLVLLFGNNTFNRTKVLKNACSYLKDARH
ncbi:uncharacterized protein LOC131049460 isoform X2 [Cryptomeria japonica]|uniref:uncharacterized protein LOC131049460 isoform X2 n=1 Tax=Cryptomeria japonica TaxID=3369 RepID=UPI0027DA9F82|nr:uncharacterized protein LOC131049460 isoform X2 [Cryptomeria japonica]